MIKNHARTLISLLAVACVTTLAFTDSVDFISFAKDNGIERAGFFSGLWHGLIILPAFCFSIFNEKVAIYAVQNTGAAYDFGFLLGTFLYYLIFCDNSPENEREIP